MGDLQAERLDHESPALGVELACWRMRARVSMCFNTADAYPGTHWRRAVDDDISEQAKSLGRRGASAGGRARAARLSPDERREISRRAAETRWGGRAVPATHTGALAMGDRVVECAVIEDGTRVINQGTMLRALGRSRRPKSNESGTVLFATNLQPYVAPDLAKTLSNPIVYITPAGARAHGYPAQILPDVCDIYLAARREGGLLASQLPAAEAAELLVQSLARVGIIALVDEATGYQEVRARNELQVILDHYVQPEFRPWIRKFPDDFFRQIYRLQGWQYRPDTSKRTPFVGRLINKYIYEQLPPGVLEELQRRNPRGPSGHRPRKHFQHLTADTGIEHLDQQIGQVTMLLRIAKDKDEFEDIFDRAFPPLQPRLPLPVGELDNAAPGEGTH